MALSRSKVRGVMKARERRQQRRAVSFGSSSSSDPLPTTTTPLGGADRSSSLSTISSKETEDQQQTQRRKEASPNNKKYSQYKKKQEVIEILDDTTSDDDSDCDDASSNSSFSSGGGGGGKSSPRPEVISVDDDDDDSENEDEPSVAPPPPPSPPLAVTLYNADDVSRLFGTAYDQPQQHPQEQLRALKHWYICTIDDDRLLLPLPELCHFVRECVVRGWLQPRNPKTHEPIWVEIVSPDMVVVDRSKSDRGYWLRPDEVVSSSWYYWLQEPCTQQRHGKKSQADVCWEDRAKLALISIWLDKVLLRQDGDKKRTPYYYANRAIQCVYKEDILERRQGAIRKDVLQCLDLAFVSKYRKFLALHLVDCDENFGSGGKSYFTADCAFIKSLETIKRSGGSLGRKQIEGFTLQAEQALGQEPWGAPILRHPKQRMKKKHDNHSTQVAAAVASSLRDSSSSEEMGHDSSSSSSSSSVVSGTDKGRQGDRPFSRGVKAPSLAAEENRRGSQEHQQQQLLPSRRRRLQSRAEPVRIVPFTPTTNAGAAPATERHRSRNVAKKTIANKKKKKKQPELQHERKRQRVEAEESSSDDEDAAASTKRARREGNDDTLVMARDDGYSRQTMQQSLERLCRFLDPSPKILEWRQDNPYGWRTVQEVKFKLNTPELFNENFISADAWKITSEERPARLEMQLIFVEACANACQDVNTASMIANSHLLESVVEVNEASPSERSSVAFRLLFVEWPSVAMTMLRKDQKEEKESTALYLLEAVLRLVANLCQTALKNQRRLELLSLRKNDWEQLLQQVQPFVEHFPELTRAFQMARVYQSMLQSTASTNNDFGNYKDRGPDVTTTPSPTPMCGKKDRPAAGGDREAVRAHWKHHEPVTPVENTTRTEEELTLPVGVRRLPATNNRHEEYHDDEERQNRKRKGRSKNKRKHRNFKRYHKC